MEGLDLGVAEDAVIDAQVVQSAVQVIVGVVAEEYGVVSVDKQVAVRIKTSMAANAFPKVFFLPMFFLAPAGTYSNSSWLVA